MQRTQIYLSREENEALERIARQTKRSKSQLIREAIDHMYLKSRKEAVLRALDASYGAWKNRKFTGEEYVEKLRNGRSVRKLKAYERDRRR